MTVEQLTKLHENMHEAEQAILTAKGADYVGVSGDRLDNFRWIAKKLELTPRQVWAVHAMKHVDAILTWAATGKVDSENMTGRFHDLRNYALLGAALYREEIPDDD